MAEPKEVEGIKTFGMYVKNAWKRIHATRPLSFYLLLALFVMLPLGARLLTSSQDPKRLAFFVTLHLVFLFVLVVQALYDVVEITKNHFKERERLFRSTLGDSDFTRELGHRVSEHRKDA